ncbi:unnamed protein product [Ophioblennius macclurei]
MKFVVPLFAFLAVAAFNSVLSASLESAESAEKEEKAAEHDGLAELKKIDQMEFEAAQKEKAAQMNVTEEQTEESRYEAAQDGSVEERVETESEKTGGGGSPAAAAQQESESESSEETDGRKKREHHEAATETVSNLGEAGQDAPKQQDVLE